MLTIKYKDRSSWITVSGKVINWDRYAETNKEGRLLPTFLAPVITTDTWNGKDIEVQHTIWEVWEVEMWVKESELHHITKLQSCSDVIFQDDELRHEVKPFFSEDIVIDEPERVEDTSNFAVKIRYRTEKTVVNKVYADESNYTTKLEMTYRTETAVYYSLLEGVKMITNPELNQYDNGDGITTNAKIITKTGYKYRFYLPHSEAVSLAEMVVRATEIKINENVMSFADIADVTEIAEGLSKVDLSLLDSINVYYPEETNELESI